MTRFTILIKCSSTTCSPLPALIKHEPCFIILNDDLLKILIVSDVKGKRQI